MRDGHARTSLPRTGGATAGAQPFCTSRWNASAIRPGWGSGAALTALAACTAAFALTAPAAASTVLHALLWPTFGLSAGLRLTAAAVSRRCEAPAPDLPEDALPTYTILAPLYREHRVAAQLVDAIARLDYPADRLQVLLVLEPDDAETWPALAALHLPACFEIFVAPPGSPRTKPRACNEALEHARGEFLVIYDAEDRPEPRQLREAAARFRADPEVSCLQAPLRIDRARTFLQRQFALEYAAQFEVMLPGLHRLGAPFPLGGSSNHFRTAVLRELGGWDAYNVTEDADLGFRLAAAGHRTGLLRTPTWEIAPRGSGAWLRQRGRWLKGHLQTWCVHMRRPGPGGWPRLLGLQATLGLGLVSAFAHAPLLLLLLFELSRSGANGRAYALAFAGAGWGVSVLVMALGAGRRNLPFRWSDALGAPLYWPLHTIAAVRAVIEWFRRPFHWDKTDHRPVR
ncbi:MAG TPA: glycosyltransferase [Caulobacteraceae bacterium]|jgi:hypothetical protein